MAESVLDAKERNFETNIRVYTVQVCKMSKVYSIEPSHRISNVSCVRVDEV